MASQAPRHALALPPAFSPDDLDTLSELSSVLARVRAGIESAAGLNSAGTGATPGAHAPGSGPGALAHHGGGGGGGGGAQQLSFKDVPGATDGLKHKLQHARAQVRALPDMDRSIDEQQREIAELEARIERQRQLLERLRDGGLCFGKEDGSGGDIKMELL